jgi:sugar/nucleoside kinase (ribokinase family)
MLWHRLRGIARWLSAPVPAIRLDCRDGERTEIPVQMTTPVDATGAGDQFAAGFLYGLATGRDMATAGRMGCIAAAEVIGHIGARPQTDLRVAFARAGLIAA